MSEAQHGSEDFRVREIAAWFVEFDHGGSDEVSLLEPRDGGAPAIDQHATARRLAALDEPLDALPAFCRDDRAHLDVGLETIADTAGRRGLEQARCKRLARFTHWDRDRRGQTPLARASEG